MPLEEYQKMRLTGIGTVGIMVFQPDIIVSGPDGLSS